MIKQGDVISYLDMCKEEGVNLQRGMNFRLKGGFSVILMSTRPGAPYADRIEDEGKTLIYEGHDAQRNGGTNPKLIDQPFKNPNGAYTQNGLFYIAAKKYSSNKEFEPELVKVYEKIKPGIWVYNGIFKLVDAWQEKINNRMVFKFKLELLNDEDDVLDRGQHDIDHNRIIPTSVKLEVWRRDKGRCVKCGSRDVLARNNRAH